MCSLRYLPNLNAMAVSFVADDFEPAVPEFQVGFQMISLRPFIPSFEEHNLFFRFIRGNLRECLAQIASEEVGMRSLKDDPR